MRVILLSGKRFAGKDEVKQILLGLLSNSVGLSLADECKRMYAEDNNLDSNRLIGDRDYKEIYRNGLTEFYQKSLTKDEFFFESYVESIIKTTVADIIIIADIRTQNNLKYFRKMFGINCISIRINSSIEEKCKRGWIETNYDTSSIEIGLDSVDDWDYTILNNGTLNDLNKNTLKVALDINKTVI